MSYTIDDIFERLQQKQKQGEIETAYIDPRSKEYAQIQADDLNKIIGNANEYDGYNCSKCNNRGFIHIVKENTDYSYYYASQTDCECKPIRNTLRRAKESGLGDILTANTFPKYETIHDWQKQIKDKAQAFCQDEQAKWFYMGGQTGAGKTHLCTAITGHYIKKGYNCRYMLWRDDAVKLKSLVGDNWLYQEKIAPFKKADVLYIDDFLKTQDGTEPTRADLNLAFEIINFRYQDSKKITIISSEFTLNKALEFDEATIGRIYQLTGNYKINIDKDRAKNYRLKG